MARARRGRRRPGDARAALSEDGDCGHFAVLEISHRHPTADGRTFGDLHAGDTLDHTAITAVELIPYAHPFTYDILPASGTHTYFAGGALIGTTLTP